MSKKYHSKNKCLKIIWNQIFYCQQAMINKKIMKVLTKFNLTLKIQKFPIKNNFFMGNRNFSIKKNNK